MTIPDLILKPRELHVLLLRLELRARIARRVELAESLPEGIFPVLLATVNRWFTADNELLVCCHSFSYFQLIASAVLLEDLGVSELLSSAASAGIGIVQTSMSRRPMTLGKELRFIISDDPTLWRGRAEAFFILTTELSEAAVSGSLSCHLLEARPSRVEVEP